jgi:hypothetical protein
MDNISNPEVARHYEAWYYANNAKASLLNKMSRFYMVELNGTAAVAAVDTLPTYVNNTDTWNSQLNDYAFFIKRIRGVISESRAASTPIAVHGSLATLFTFQLNAAGYSMDFFPRGISFGVFQAGYDINTEEFGSSWVIPPKNAITATFGIHPQQATLMVGGGNTPVLGASSYLLQLYLIGELINVG